MLRRSGLRPATYGQSALRDFVKFQAYRLGKDGSRLRHGAPAETHHY